MFALFAAAWADCPDLDAILESTLVDVMEVRNDAVVADLERFRGGLGCGDPVTASQLGKYWLYEAVNASVMGDALTTEDAMSALVRVAPQAFEDRFGSEIRAAYEEALKADPGQARIELEPGLGTNRAWLDGEPMSVAEDTAAGLHAVQVAGPRGDVLFGEVVFLGPNQTMRLDTGVPPGVEEAPRRLRVKRVGWLAAAGGTFVAGLGFGIAASAQTSKMRQSQGFRDLDRAYTRQRVLGGLGYGLLGGTVVTATLFAVPL